MNREEIEARISASWATTEALKQMLEDYVMPTPEAPILRQRGVLMVLFDSETSGFQIDFVFKGLCKYSTEWEAFDSDWWDEEV